MPIYEYRCGECQTKFEKLIRRELDETSLVCPECKSTYLEKEYSTFAPQANGRAAALPGNCGEMACPKRHMCGCH